MWEEAVIGLYCLNQIKSEKVVLILNYASNSVYLIAIPSRTRMHTTRLHYVN